MKAYTNYKKRHKLLEQEHDIKIDKGYCKNTCEDIWYCVFKDRSIEQWDKLFKEYKI